MKDIHKTSRTAYRRLREVTAVVLLLFSPYSLADEDIDLARDLVATGDILPLEQVVLSVKGDRNWRLIEVELEREDGEWIYEFELLDDKGRVRELKVDARSGKILEDE